MHRRTLLLTAAVALAAPRLAAAQADMPALEIDPQNELEEVFVQAVDRRDLRAVFRRRLLQSRVVLALASNAPDSPPREISPSEGVHAGLIFTGTQRMDTVLGPMAPRVSLTGRAALERLRGRHVIVNAQLVPMLVLEPEDVAAYLDGSATSAGPAQ
jgi:hypothetical protein